MSKTTKVTMTKTLQLRSPSGRGQVCYVGGKTYNVDAETLKQIKAEKAGVESEDGVTVAPAPKQSLPPPGKDAKLEADEKTGDDKPFEAPDEVDADDGDSDPEDADEESEDEEEEEKSKKPRRKRRK